MEETTQVKTQKEETAWPTGDQEWLDGPAEQGTEGGAEWEGEPGWVMLGKGPRALPCHLPVASNCFLGDTASGTPFLDHAMGGDCPVPCLHSICPFYWFTERSLLADTSCLLSVCPDTWLQVPESGDLVLLVYCCIPSTQNLA